MELYIISTLIAVTKTGLLSEIPMIMRPNIDGGYTT
jgi:hypothetical protein